MKITVEILKSLGYITKYPERKVLIAFAGDRDSYVTADEYGEVTFTKFTENRTKEMFRGHVESEEELQNIINQHK